MKEKQRLTLFLRFISSNTTVPLQADCFTIVPSQHSLIIVEGVVTASARQSGIESVVLAINLVLWSRIEIGIRILNIESG